MYIVVAIFLVTYCPLIYYFRNNHFHEVQAIADSLIIVGNVLLLIFLIRKLEKFQSYEMKQSFCSIYTQFFLFLVSYVVIAVTDSIFGWLRVDFMKIFFWHEFILFMNEILPLIPICYVLYVHS